MLSFTASPACQRWLAAKASSVLSSELQTEVSIGHARIGLFNRIVIDDVLLRDQEGDTLLAAARLSAKLDVWQLTQGKVYIDNIQLFGYDIRLRRHTPDAPYNFQFIVDRFASTDTTETPLDLKAGSIIVRRGTLRHDLDYEPFSDRFTPAHLCLDNLGFRASIETLSKESILLNINKLKFVESNSGFELADLGASLDGTADRVQLADLDILLPRSELHIPQLTVYDPLASLDSLSGTGSVVAAITPADLQSFLPLLSGFDDLVRLSGRLEKRGRRVDLHELTLDTHGLDVAMRADGQLQLDDTTLTLPFGAAELFLDRFHLDRHFCEKTLQALAPYYPALSQASWVKPLLSLGDLQVSGQLSGSAHPHRADADLHLSTALGDAAVKGALIDGHQFDVQATTEKLALSTLALASGTLPVDNVNLRADVKGSLREPSAAGTLALTDLHIKDKVINRLDADFDFSPDRLKARLVSDDDEYALKLTADLRDIGGLSLDAATLEKLQGQVVLEDVRIRSAAHNYDLHQLKLALDNDDHGHHLVARGDFINARADGRFSYSTLVPTVRRFLHHVLPSLKLGPDESSSMAHAGTSDQVDFSLHLWNANPIFNLFDLDVQLPEAAYVQGVIDGPERRMNVEVDVPRVIYGSEDLRSLTMTVRQENDSVNSTLSLQRMMEEGPVGLTVSADGGSDVLTSMIAWDNHQSPSQRGELSAVTRFFRDPRQQLGAEVNILQGQLVVSDTIWNVHASKMLLHDGAVDVNGFEVSQLGRHLRVDGRVSKDAADTLYADLRDINLQYVFGIIDFHDVEFAGSATGRVKVHDIFKHIAVDADLTVSDFTLNDGLLGTVYVRGGFGRKDDRAIDIDAYIHEPVHNEISHVVGLIKPGHEEGRGMQLDIQARYLNTYFINYFTEGIFTDLQGHATGHAYLHGPFKRLDLEGELVVDTLSTTIDVLGTHYHLLGGDSVHLYPGGIRFSDVRVYDDYHVPGNGGHSAVLNGELRFQHFKNMHYDFDIVANNILGYDFRDFGDQSFFGTVFADGDVTLSGKPGALTVDLRCRPAAGTVFTYNVSTPDAITDNEFITFVSDGASDRAPSLPPGGASDSNSLSEDMSALPRGGREVALGGHEVAEAVDESSDEPNDIRVNFDLDITPDAQMRLLMDPRSEDYITLFGNAHIRASFYNKGPFRMYGTYRVDHGTYRLSLQDVIRKEFRFQPGGTIVFGGQPMKAALDLQAIYTVPGVSLNDLAAGSNFSNSTVRVNCLMNLGGQAEHPQVSFDFDIPNVNEDEKQMVRSLISTDEERNLQVIYLLGIGRFYTYGLGNDESQANAAVQSLLSSTLSGQLNDFLANAIGNGNWNFGTNLSTGTLGWQDMDVEGSLSGRLLGNRLLINGTFGYRDTPIANTNFIGDFDVQWLLTPSGNLSLKAYSETNDRYFTKTALTTQGIGIQVRKDFNTLRELFLPRQRAKK